MWSVVGSNVSPASHALGWAHRCRLLLHIVVLPLASVVLKDKTSVVGPGLGLKGIVLGRGRSSEAVCVYACLYVAHSRVYRS